MKENPFEGTILEDVEVIGYMRGGIHQPTESDVLSEEEIKEYIKHTLENE